jgi:hypothetical protein
MPSQKFMHRARITRMPRGASVSEPGHIDRVPYRRFGNVYLYISPKPAPYGALVLSHEVKVLGDLLEQVSDGGGQFGMSGGEVGPGSGLASPGLGHCLAEEFMVDLPQ